MKSSTIIILASCLLVSCQRTKPQAPSHHAEQDSVKVAMLLVTQRLAEEADKELTQYASRTNGEYTLDDFGFWYKYLKRTDGNYWQKGEQVLIHTQIFSLKGELLLDSKEQIEIGKGNAIPAIEDMLLMMRKNEACELLVPWYLAFGASGNENIAPYTNIRIDIETHTTD